MINLLPYETKKSIRAARTNTTLIKYLFCIILASIFLALACLMSYLILDNSKKTAEQALVDVKTKNSSYSPVTTKSDKFISDLTTAKTILDSDILYSTIITNLANCLPAGVILESPLTLNSQTVGVPITLRAHAKIASDETALKSNFQKSSYFTDYSLQSVANNTDGSNYPILISFTITINKASAK